MKRRAGPWVMLLALALLATPLAGGAQPAGKIYRIGYLTPFPLPHPTEKAFREGLHDLGYVEGHNIVIEAITAEHRYGDLGKLAAELVAKNVDVIVVHGGFTAREAKKVTLTIPIVMAGSGDAVAQGLVESLRRPGGNVTGLTATHAQLAPKRLEILKETLPHLKKLAALWCPEAPINHVEADHVRAAAKTLDIHVRLEEFTTGRGWSQIMEALLHDRPDALFLFDCTGFPFPTIVDFALTHRLPMMAPYESVARRGALLAYGADGLAMARRAGIYVDKILKGAKPADLPVEEPTKFELVINMKTAKALMLTIHPSVLARADQVIE